MLEAKYFFVADVAHQDDIVRKAELFYQLVILAPLGIGLCPGKDELARLLGLLLSQPLEGMQDFRDAVLLLMHCAGVDDVGDIHCGLHSGIVPVVGFRVNQYGDADDLCVTPFVSFHEQLQTS